MDRETEKLMKELQQFLALHGAEATDEDSVERLTDRFLSEYGVGHPRRKDMGPESADDYLELADQASSKKKSLEYLHKALELEPENEETLWELFESAVTHVCIGKGGEISLSQKDQKECAS